jgi:hypothetical protein
MGLADFVIPILAAALFTLVGYGILNSQRQHAETIGEILWTAFCICASLILMTGAFQLAESRRASDNRGDARPATAERFSRSGMIETAAATK